MKEWLAAYLYYAEPWETFLLDAVKPFTEEVLRNGFTDQFFFVRYWERGPHIRLRFKGEAGTLKEKVKPALELFFTDYFRSKPSSRIEPGGASDWFPNDSVQFVEYEPETQRYGGPAGILIAEKQFESSSKAVLSILEESQHWDYDRALGAAIQMHLGFAFAMGMTWKDSVRFFHQLSERWMSLLLDPRSSPEDLQSLREQISNAFATHFEQQKSALIPYHRLVWDALEKNAEFEQEWLNTWVQEVLETARELKQAQDKGELALEGVVESPLHEGLWSILDSYVHMTNNRLGVLNRDEAYLGYLMKRSLESLGDASHG